MLPPRELNTHCPRCHTPLDDEQRICGECGANRELEMQLAVRLEPAIASLRRWLLVLGGVSLLLSGVLYLHYDSRVPGPLLYQLVLPGLLAAAAMFVLAALARRWPFGVSVVALGLFLLHWGNHALADPASAFLPGIGLLLRVMFLVVLAGAVRAGHEARTLRKQAGEAIPSATARYR